MDVTFIVLRRYDIDVSGFQHIESVMDAVTFIAILTTFSFVRQTFIKKST